MSTRPGACCRLGTGHQLFTMAPDGTDVQEVEGVSPEGAIPWNPLG